MGKPKAAREQDVGGHEDALLEVLERIGRRADELAAEFHRVSGLLAGVHEDADAGARCAPPETRELWQRLRAGAAEGRLQAHQMITVLSTLAARLTEVARVNRGPSGRLLS